MAPFIRAVFSNLIGEEEAGTIDIVSNDADIHPDGTWEIKFRHPTRYEAFSIQRAIEFKVQGFPLRPVTPIAIASATSMFGAARGGVGVLLVLDLLRTQS